jgi:cytochrome c oxidase subunit 3
MFALRPTGDLVGRPDRGPDGEPKGVGTLGVRLFLASLAFLFAASILLYLLLLVPADAPPQALLPVVGVGLAVATAVMLASSWTLALGVRAIRADDRDGLRRHLRSTFGLAVGFLVAQSVNWLQVVLAGLPLDATNKHSALFVVLTVLHALHVIGGVIPLGVITVRAGRGVYTARNHEGVVNVALYWHFLDLVWLLMLVAVVVVST